MRAIKKAFVLFFPIEGSAPMGQDYNIGQQVGDYEILGILGAGGMGKVYKVRNAISDRVEAMKILLPNLAGQKELGERFLREIKLLASLNHPNIAALRTALTLDNQLVMIMEYVDGVSLSSRLLEGPVPPGQAVSHIDQVLAALSYAHQQHIIHRDIKPANMMLTTDGVVKLMDFGIARSSTDRSLTMTGTTLGSLNYMPPEQVKGEPADNRSDLYSLGVSLYELVTGELPFQAESSYALMAAHLEQTPKPPNEIRPGIPESLNQIILMAMAKNPAQRFQSADAFRAALKSVPTQGVRTQPVPASPVPIPPTRLSSVPPLFQDSVLGAPPASLVDAPAHQGTQPLAPPATREASAPAPVVARNSHRGVYIGLGAFIVVAVLFVAGLYLPRREKTQAGGEKSDKSMFPPEQSQPGSAPSPSTGPADSSSGTVPSLPSTPTSPASPTDSPASSATPSGAQSSSPTPSQSDTSGSSAIPATPEQPPALLDNGAAGSSTKSAKKTSSASSKKTPAAKGSGAKQGSGQTSASGDASQAQTEASAEAEEVEQQYDQINSRSTAVSQSLDTLKREQAKQGYGLRGDIVAAEQRMQSNLSKAQYFMQKQDTKNAKKYLDMAEGELQTIEKFLGH
jgi:serine/threonine protein kinase